MADVYQRVAKVEQGYDGLSDVQKDLKESVRVLEARMDAGFSEVRAEFKSMRTEMHTQFRWVMGGIGGALLTILIAMFGLAATIVFSFRG